MTSWRALASGAPGARQLLLRREHAMHYEFEAMRDRCYESLAEMAGVIANGQAEPEDLERLVKDRDEIITSLYAGLGVTVLELAARTGIPWPQVYRIIDRVREEKRSKSPFSALGGM